MEPTWVKLTILDELYADILGTNYSRLMGPIVLSLLDDVKENNAEVTPEDIDSFISEEYISLINEGLIAEINNGENRPNDIVITLKGREVYEQYL